MSGVAISKYYGVYQGLPAVGGTLQVYQTGTTTPVTPYADAALMTPLSNPITLDANGTCIFYYSGSVNLKLVAYTASGTLIETLDPVYPTGGATAGTTIKISSNITITAQNAGNNLISTTAVNFTLPLTTSLSSSFNFTANAQGGAITLIPQSSDIINGGSIGANYVLAKSGSTEVWTDANGNWGLNFVATGGGSVLLQTIPISSAASVAFTSSLTGYSEYLIKGRGLILISSASQIGITVTFNAVSSNYLGNAIVTGPSSQVIVGSSGTGGAHLSLDGSTNAAIATAALAVGGSFDFQLYVPSSAINGIGTCRWNGASGAVSGAYMEIYQGQGANITSSAVMSSVTFSFASNLVGGSISLYGIPQ